MDRFNLTTVRMWRTLVVSLLVCVAVLPAPTLGQYERAVTKAISVAPTSNQFAAMTSLCFNIGPTNFAKSSVVRRMNEGNPKAAADAFLLWNKAGGKVRKGLTARREDEKKLFLTRST